MDFLSAFDHKAENKCQPPPASPDAVWQIESLDSLSPDMALTKMQELVMSSAPNLYKVTNIHVLHLSLPSVSLLADHISVSLYLLQAFSAFDQDRTGTVRALEFRQVLESFCARLSDKQYRHLLTKLDLDCDSSTVNWKDFLNKFQSPSPLVRDAITQDKEMLEHFRNDAFLLSD